MDTQIKKTMLHNLLKSNSEAVGDIFGEDMDWSNQFITMNDIEELTFPQIASKIREMAAEL